MKYQRLSTRQNLAMTWWNRPGFEDYEGIICDGSIRSGKTVAMTVGFIMWAMSNFSGQNFALCGKTIESLRRNVTSNLSAWLCGVFTFKEHRTENKIVVRAGNKTNSFYLFGGKIIPINQVLKMNSQYSGSVYLIVNRSPVIWILLC